MFKAERKLYQGFNFLGRLKALGIHLIFSLTIFAAFMWLMLIQWFPQPHFTLNGGWQGVRIMVMVDLVIGPLLTFFLYNNRKGKKELRFDLGFIIIFQLGLLIYGVATVYSQRPVVQVLSHRGYIATPREEDLIYDKNRITNPVSYIKGLNPLNIKPPLVYSVFMTDEKLRQLKNIRKPFYLEFYSYDEKEIKRKEGLVGELSPEKIISRYLPINSLYAQSMLAEAEKRGFKRLLLDEANKIAIEKYLAEHQGNFYFFRFLGEYGEAVMVLDSIGRPVDYFNIKRYDE